MQPDTNLQKFLADRAIIVSQSWDGSWSITIRQIVTEREAMRVAMLVLSDEPERWVGTIEDVAVGE